MAAEAPHHWNRRSRSIWKIVLFSGSIFVYCTRTTMSICAVKMEKELGWDKRISGFVMSSFFFGYVLTQIIGGILADKYGGERTLFLSACVWSVCTLCTPLVGGMFGNNEAIGMSFVQSLAGIAQGFHFPSLASLISFRVAEKHRNSAFSFITSGVNMGTLLTGSVGSVLLEYHGWRFVFICFGVLSLLWALTVKFVTFIGNINNTQNPTIDDVGRKLRSRNPMAEPVPWRKLCTNVPFWALFVTSSLESFVFTTLISWLPTYFHEMYPNSKPWVYNVLPWVANFLSSNISGMISDRAIARGVSITRLRKCIVCTSMFACALLCLVIKQVTSLNAALVLITILCFFVGLNACGVGTNPQDLMPNNSGVLYVIMNTASAFSGMLGVSLMGHLLHNTQDWSNSFTVISLAASAGGVVFLIFGSGKRIA